MVVSLLKTISSETTELKKKLTISVTVKHFLEFSIYLFKERLLLNQSSERPYRSESLKF